MGRLDVARFLGVEPTAADRLLDIHALPRGPDGTFSSSDIAALGETLRDPARHGHAWTRDLHRDGLVVVEDVVDPRAVQAIIGAGLQQASLASEEVEVLRSAHGRPVRVNGLEHVPGLLSILADFGLVQLVRAVIDEPILYRVSLVRRSDREPPELGAHRDPFWARRVYADPVLAIGMHASVVSGRPGDVYVQPGTHLLHGGSAASVRRRPDTERIAVVPTGAVSIHNLGVVHGADVYEVPVQRLTLYCSFCSTREARASDRWPGRGGTERSGRQGQ